MRPRRSPTSARSRCARTSTSSRPSGASSPATSNIVVRRALISTANAAGFISLHGFPIGQARGNHWGDAVTRPRDDQLDALLLQLPPGRPRQLHDHRPVGLGQDGGAELPRRPGAEVRAAHDPVRQGPRRGDLPPRARRPLRADHSRRADRLQPAALPDNAANRAFLRDWLGVLLEANGAEEETAIADAVDAIFAHGPELRRLRFLRELLGGGRRPQPGDLPSRLDPWIVEGEHAWLFDNEDDELDFETRVLGFDMTALLEDRRLRTPAMMYLFHRIEERLDGPPTMILIDEGWKALDDRCSPRASATG